MTLQSRLITLAMAAGLAQAAHAGVLEDIKAKGVLTVAVKADYPPFGFRDPSGQIVGMEADLAADVARRLGVRLQLEPVVASSRLQFLAADKADLAIATMAVTADRRKEAGVIEPYYYAAGVAMLVPRAANIRSGADLKGKVVCAIPDSDFSGRLRALTGQALAGFKSVAKNEMALLDGRCAAFVHDDVILIYEQRTLEKWKDYEVVPLDIAPRPWAVAVKAGEKDAAWGRFVADTVRDWHRSGTLVEAEKKWLGQNTKWVLEQHQAAK
jgi:polar amino acid transport system substrate-binding protein